MLFCVEANVIVSYLMATLMMPNVVDNYINCNSFFTLFSQGRMTILEQISFLCFYFSKSSCIIDDLQHYPNM